MRYAVVLITLLLSCCQTKNYNNRFDRKEIILHFRNNKKCECPKKKFFPIAGPVESHNQEEERYVELPQKKEKEKNTSSSWWPF